MEVNSEILKETLLDVAKKMALAAVTAPKAKGRNTLSAIIVEGDELIKLADFCKTIGEKSSQQFFVRDGENLRRSDVVLLLATRIEPLGMSHCGYCGVSNCGSKQSNAECPCAFNTMDLGIAIGSAVSIAADNRVDSRVMFSVGYAAREMRLFDSSYKIVMAIPLSATSKSIYFDR